MPCRLSSSQDLNVRLDFLNHVSNFKKMKWLITKLISSMQEQSSILILSFPFILRKNLLRTVLIDKIIRLIHRRQLQLALSTHLWDITGSLKKSPFLDFTLASGIKAEPGIQFLIRSQHEPIKAHVVSISAPSSGSGQQPASSLYSSSWVF